MYNLLSNLLSKYNIELVAPIPLSECTVKRQYLLDRAQILDGTAFIIAVPYLSKEAFSSARNVSLYAVARDYHLFFDELFGEILPILRERFPNAKFAAFADHSPIDEVNAAAKAGLGILGDNGMLICEKYSSFVFLGEIITDMHIQCKLSDIKKCEGCKKCSAVCKGNFFNKKEGCISHLSQKKGEADELLSSALLSSGLVWGCDECSLSCPYTQMAITKGTIFTSVPFFNTDIIPYLSAETVKNMSDEDFSARAYSWRGKETILRNLEIFEAFAKKERNDLC
jgi:epoxyqueuosine reductase